jgi:tetratricopeptide (TPR) repeat protein
VQTYLNLAHLHARKNVVSETKRNLIEYIERMNTLGKLDDAFVQVKAFADQHSGNQDIRMMLVELLRAASRTQEAREQLEKMAGELEARGDRAGARKTRERMHSIDAAPHQAEATPDVAKPPAGGLVFIETGIQAAAPARAGAAPAPFAPPEPAPEPPRHPEVESSPLEGLDTFDPGGLDVETSSGETLVPGLQETTFGEDTGAGEAPVEPLDGLLIDGAAGLERGMPVADEVAAPDDFLIERAASADEIVLDAEPAGPSLDLDPAFGTAAEELDDTVPDAFNLLPDADLESPSELEPPPELGSSAEPMYADDFDVGDTPLDFIATGDAESDETHAPDGFAPEPGPTATADAIASLEDRILENPEDPALHRDLAAALAGAGDSTRAIEEYSIAVTGFEAGSAWESALDAVDAILALEPDAVRYQQKRVELAYRTGDRARLLSAYLDLADTLVRAGASDKAAAVYGRILEHDPTNQRAREAMAAIAPPEPEPEAAPAPAPPPVAAPAAPPPASRRPAPSAPPAGFVDLGSMVIEEEGPRDTRMKYQHERPTGDEQKDFLETLEQFKKGIEANLGTEDYEAHYDLGIAFKEMGLLDEAIAEFQKALRAPNGRMRTSEALGVTFFEKGQFAIAETILRRAVESLEGGDDAKIGLLYWLGRACEEQGRRADARASYERALAVDIRFMDLSERIQRLTAAK